MTATMPTPGEYVACANRVLRAANGISYAYREVGEGTPPLVLLQHFRGNLDNWDPALIDALASARRVVTFDNVGVGGSTGTTPSAVTQMAIDAIAFLDAMDFVEVDVLGFSIGSFVAQEIALLRPGAVRRLALASSAPRGAAGMHGWAPGVIQAVGGAAPQSRRLPQRVLHELGVKPARGVGDPGANNRTRRGPRQANHMADSPGAVRRGLRVGNPRSRPATAGRRHRRPGLRRERRQRPDDPPALLVPARRADPASAGQDLPRRRARVPVPALCGIRRRRRDIPEHAAMTSASNGPSA